MNPLPAYLWQLFLRIRALHLLSPSVLVTASSCDHSIKVWGLDTDRLMLLAIECFLGTRPLSHRSLPIWCCGAERVADYLLTRKLLSFYGKVDTMIDGTKKHENITTYAWLIFSNLFLFHRVSPVRLLCSVDTGCRVTCLSAWHPGLRLAELEHLVKQFNHGSVMRLQSLIQLLHVLCSRWSYLF